MSKEISIIIPCYNEDISVLNMTIQNIKKSLEQYDDFNYEIIVINDGSENSYDEINDHSLTLIHHHKNLGYGASLKTGITRAKYNWIGITDADGTYPNIEFNQLLNHVENYDMIIGQRNWNDISLIRRFPKYILTSFASFLANYRIPDLNSGMRVFKKEVALKFWQLYPNGFSFTSTLTMGCITNGYAVKFLPISYNKRIGNSSIQPIRDTIRFFKLVTRLSLYFNPTRFFMPISFVLFLAATARGLRDYLVNDSFGGLTLVLFFMAFQLFFFGLIAEIISKTRK